MNLFLIGFMGSGKTQTGLQLADELGWDYLDTDSLIEEKNGNTIAELFNKKGESWFRKEEERILDKIIEEQLNDAVISTGGGLPCFSNNIQKMKANGKVLFLSPPFPELIERLKKEDSETKSRPILANKSEKEWEEIYHKRLPIYRQAHAISEFTCPMLSDLLTKIPDLLTNS